MANRSSIQLDELKAGESGETSVVNPLEYIAAFDLSGNQLVYADWVLSMIAGLRPPVQQLFYPAGTALPIVLTAFQTSYSAYGRFPRITAKQVNGQAIVTGALTGGTGYTNGSYPGTPLTGGDGGGATANITVAGGIITVCTIVDPGTGYINGNLLSAAGLGGGTLFGFTVSTTTAPAFTYLTGETVKTTELTTAVGLPDTVSIDVDNAGGILGDNIILMISAG